MKKLLKRLSVLGILLIPFLVNAEEIEVKYPAYVNKNFKVEFNKNYNMKYQWVDYLSEEEQNAKIDEIALKYDAEYEEVSNSINDKNELIKDLEIKIKDTEEIVNCLEETKGYQLRLRDRIVELGDRILVYANNPTQEGADSYLGYFSEYISMTRTYNNEFGDLCIKCFDKLYDESVSFNNYILDPEINYFTPDNLMNGPSTLYDDLEDIISDNKQRIIEFSDELTYLINRYSDLLLNNKNKLSTEKNNLQALNTRLTEIYNEYEEEVYSVLNIKYDDNNWKPSTDGSVEIPEPGNYILWLSFNNETDSKVLGIVYYTSDFKDDNKIGSVNLDTSDSEFEFIISSWENSDDEEPPLPDSPTHEANDPTNENPKTGMFISFGSIILLLVLGIVFAKYSKKNLFNRI